MRRRFGIGHVTLQPEQVGGVNPGRQPRVRIVPREDGEEGA
jgi:hypothetical protein